MIYEKRTYTLNPLKMADWLALYKSDAYAVQTEHLGKLIGFFFTEIGVESGGAYLGLREPRRSPGTPGAHGAGRTLADLLA
jgi:hypothetical protein